ncbi:MAG TPA: hypothetical protein V6C97_19715 [Oculatellaceae cyanobacterium]
MSNDREIRSTDALTRTGVVNTPAQLSAEAFSDPAKFLEVIKKDFNKISLNHHDIGKHDLELYSRAGDDAEGRAAAKIAAEHFNELEKIDGRANAGGDTRYLKDSGVLTASALDSDISLIKGDASSQLANVKFGDACAMAYGGFFVGVGAIASLFAWETPAIGATAATAVFGGVIMADAWDNARQAPQRMQEEIKSDQSMIRSWLVS